MSQPVVGIVMGSQSDLDVMREAADILEQLGVAYELTIVSAHRTPERMFDYAQKARERGLKVIIAGAGGAAHLPGMLASATTLPVIGVPVRSSNSIDGWDSVLSILQMGSGGNRGSRWCKKCRHPGSANHRHLRYSYRR